MRIITTPLSQEAKIFESTLQNRGVYRLSTYHTYLHKLELDQKLDFLIDCKAYQSFAKKYYPDPIPGLKAAELLTHCSQIPFAKRPGTVSLEKYNTNLGVIRDSSGELAEKYLVSTSPMFIKIDSSVAEPITKLISKGFCHPDIFHDAYQLVYEELLIGFQLFVDDCKLEAEKKPTFSRGIRRSLAAIFANQGSQRSLASSTSNSSLSSFKEEIVSTPTQSSLSEFEVPPPEKPKITIFTQVRKKLFDSAGSSRLASPAPLSPGLNSQNSGHSSTKANDNDPSTPITGSSDILSTPTSSSFRENELKSSNPGTPTKMQKSITPRVTLPITNLLSDSPQVLRSPLALNFIDSAFQAHNLSSSIPSLSEDISQSQDNVMMYIKALKEYDDSVERRRDGSVTSTH